MLAELVDRAVCVAAFVLWQDPIVKHADDLARYDHIIEVTRPDVVVECGTRGGWSAHWFTDRDCDAITIDVQPSGPDRPRLDRLTYVAGDSLSPQVFTLVQQMVAGRRVMVSLDSDHSEAHVRREIELYRELVTSGCYLVVEDGVIDWLPSPKPHGCDVYTGSVLTAIEDTLVGDDRFDRDDVIETMTPITMSPAGWWLRRG
jgi:cephalosporin hydroxylase